MKYFAALVAAAMVLIEASAFSSSSFGGTQLSLGVQNSNTISMEYIPSGMSKAQWEKVKAKEKAKTQGKNLGKTGITTFKSRSFLDWQKSGGKNLFPVDPKSVKDPSELPYMQRPGGSADDSDINQKKGGFFSFFGGKKKEEPEPEPEPVKKNPWTF